MLAFLERFFVGGWTIVVTHNPESRFSDWRQDPIISPSREFIVKGTLEDAHDPISSFLVANTLSKVIHLSLKNRSHFDSLASQLMIICNDPTPS